MKEADDAIVLVQNSHSSTVLARQLECVQISCQTVHNVVCRSCKGGKGAIHVRVLYSRKEEDTDADLWCKQTVM